MSFSLQLAFHPRLVQQLHNIRGTHEYGTVNNMNGAWSARWSRDEADEFLFLVGDLWLIVDREELLGDTAQQS